MTAGAQLVRRMQRVHVPAGGELPPPLGPVSSQVIVLLRGTVHLHSSAARADDGGIRSSAGVQDGKARRGLVSSSASGQGESTLSRSGINFGNASKTGPRGCAQDSPESSKGCSTGGGCAVSDSDVTCEAAGGPESSSSSGKGGSGFSASGINFGNGSEAGSAGDGQDLGTAGGSAACSIVTAARVVEPAACEGPCLLSGAPMAEGAAGPAEGPAEVCVVAATPAECWLLGAQAVRQVRSTQG